jgi:hypothetical protein
VHVGPHEAVSERGEIREALSEAMPFEVDVSPVSTERFRSVLSAEQAEAFERGAVKARELLDGRVAWNVNSTARGGGVVELLQPLVAYTHGGGVDARWIVIDGAPDFFTVTKGIHNRLKGPAVAASRIGGIQDQTVHGESGVLLDDPRDLGATRPSLRSPTRTTASASRFPVASSTRSIASPEPRASATPTSLVIRGVVTPCFVGQWRTPTTPRWWQPC